MIHFFTINLNGMPFLASHWPTFRQLTIPWDWTVVDGAALNVGDTSWCQTLSPQNSLDGSLQYLDDLRFDQRVRVLRKPLWQGKLEMVNSAVAACCGEGLLWQVDADELWTAPQITRAWEMFQSDRSKNCGYFRCRFFLGPQIVITGGDVYGNRSEIEWRRVWRFSTGMQFASHEPPIIEGEAPRPFTHYHTESLGLVFDHMAYATEKQVIFKERYYGYADALKCWRQLQQNDTWPAKVRDWLPWVKDEAVAERL